MISLRPAVVVFAFLLFATCSPADPDDDCACPPTHECVDGRCVCPEPEKPCTLDCDPDDDSCERGVFDEVHCECRPTGTNTLIDIEVVPAALSLTAGESRQLTATGVFDNDDELDITRSVSWSSSDAGVATVTELSGVVTGLAQGSAVISARSGQVAGTATLTVFDSSENGGNGDNGGNGNNGGDHELVHVSHEREFRGAWVATAWGINFPSASSSAAQQQELVDILDTLLENGLNAVVFQVRPESDAFYQSDLEPWSRFLTGTQGQDPGYDPLAFLIEEAHARNIEVHAWLNPYRGLVNRSIPAAEPHISLTHPEYAHPCGDHLLWMDPGADAVRDHIVEVVTDIVARYGVDGIHFDDYFYPWPSNCPTFPDDDTYQAYLDGGGTMSLEDWRRDNVNEMIRLVGEAVIQEDPNVRFGVSPFGIYRQGEPPGISGTSQYDVLFSDPKKWMEERWVDYLAPQLYWPTEPAAQAYETLLEWWAGISDHGHYIFAGNAIYRLGQTGYTLDEFREQIEISRSYRHLYSKGNIFYNVGALLSDSGGIASMLRDELYFEPALTPPVVAVRDTVVSPPAVDVSGGVVTLNHPDATSVRSWVIYEEQGDEWLIDRIVPAHETSLALSQGTYAIAAACRGNVESMGVMVEID